MDVCLCALANRHTMPYSGRRRTAGVVSAVGKKHIQRQRHLHRTVSQSSWWIVFALWEQKAKDDHHQLEDSHTYLQACFDRKCAAQRYR